MRGAGADAQAALGHHGFGARYRNRNARHASFHRQIKRTFLEWQHAAIGRASALNKCGDVDALFEHAPRRGNTLSCALSTRPVAVHGDKARQPQAVAEHRDLQQGGLDEGRSTTGNAREEHHRI